MAKNFEMISVKIEEKSEVFFKKKGLTKKIVKP